MAPTWSILIPTLGQRRLLLQRLLRQLMPQVAAAAGRVRVLAYWDCGELTARLGPLDAIAHKRQTLVDAAATDYVCWLDDDDWVTSDYVSSILAALDEKPDMVGFNMRVLKNRQEIGLGRMSLRYDGWSTPQNGLYLRDVTHACPMRTEIARSVDWRDRGTGTEDVSWARRLRATGLLQTEVYIDRVLQHYDWVPTRSTWSRPGRVQATDQHGRRWRRLPVASPYFAYLEVEHLG